MILQIDGGITLHTAKIALASGINILSVGSFISSSDDPKSRFDLLNNL